MPVPQARIDAVVAKIDGYAMDKYIEAAKRIEMNDIDVALRYLEDVEKLEKLRAKVRRNSYIYIN